MRFKRLIKVVGVLTALSLLLGFYSAEASAKEKFEEKFEKTVSLAKDGLVDLKNISGSIEVKTWDKGEVKIDALKISKADTLSEAKENAAEVKIVVEKEGSILRIRTEYPDRKMWKSKSSNISVQYHLWIPDRASAKIKSVSGGVDLEEIGGTVDVNVVSGSIGIRKADKGVDCETVSGTLELQDITGGANLQTVSGRITVERIKGSVEAQTVSGGLELRDVSEAKVVKGKVLSGSIVYQGKIIPGGKYALKTHSGSIKMILPSDSAFEFEAKTFSGSIHSDFQITTSGKINRREIHGVVNNGGADVNLSTFSGSVYLKKS
jgi:hypothetical protein